MILLIRHALVDACGVFLAGRASGIHLNAEGQQQAAALGDALARVNLAAIFTSPLERTRETAGAVAGKTTPVIVDGDLNEVDFGEWTGLEFDQLNLREDWRAFNRSRSSARIPGGEWMIDVQRRACRALTGIHRMHPDDNVAIISHADVLRVLIAQIIETPIDRIDHFAIDPASISVLQPSWRGFQLTRLNCHAYRDHCCPAHH